VLEQTSEPLVLVQAGAPYHRAAALRPFWASKAGKVRLFVTRLPSSSPDYHSIEFLWRATRRRATHNRSFPAFDALIGSVEDALACFAAHPERVTALFSDRWLIDLLEWEDKPSTSERLWQTRKRSQEN